MALTRIIAFGSVGIAIALYCCCCIAQGVMLFSMLFGESWTD